MTHHAPHHTRKPDAPRGFVAGCLVNYVWVSEQADEPRRKALCGVPLHYLDRAYANARAYPEADFILWVDTARLDACSQFFVRSHLYLAGLPNLTLRCLQDIPEYRNEPGFCAKPGAYGSLNIWSVVDMARLLVLAHAFRTTGAHTLVYADFDVADISLRSDEVHGSLARHGMVFGRARDELGLYIENSYMAFDRGAGRHFLEKNLIPATWPEIRDGETGWPVMLAEIRKWRNVGPAERGSWLKKLFGIYKDPAPVADITAGIVETVGYVIPGDPLYRRERLNHSASPAITRLHTS